MLLVRGKGKPNIYVEMPRAKGKKGKKQGKKDGKGKGVLRKKAAKQKEMVAKNTLCMEQKEKEMKVQSQTRQLSNVLFKYKRAGKEEVRTYVVNSPKG